MNRPSIIQGRGTEVKAAMSDGLGGEEGEKMPFRDSEVFNFNSSMICGKKEDACCLVWLAKHARYAARLISKLG